VYWFGVVFQGNDYAIHFQCRYAADSHYLNYHLRQLALAGHARTICKLILNVSMSCVFTLFSVTLGLSGVSLGLIPSLAKSLRRAHSIEQLSYGKNCVCIVHCKSIIAFSEDV